LKHNLRIAGVVISPFACLIFVRQFESNRGLIMKTLLLVSVVANLAFVNGCQSLQGKARVVDQDKNSTMLSVEPEGDYWFDTPDGRRIIYTPVDSLLVITFSDKVMIPRK